MHCRGPRGPPPLSSPQNSPFYEAKKLASLSVLAPRLLQVISKTMPDSNVHRGDPELGGRQPHTHYHNVYGMLMARSTFEGLQRARPDKRPFVLTRANYIGGHRYAATWTGDNLANWEHLHFSIPMALNLVSACNPPASELKRTRSGNVWRLV